MNTNRYTCMNNYAINALKRDIKVMQKELDDIWHERIMLKYILRLQHKIAIYKLKLVLYEKLHDLQA
jgi:hypothetical protein